METCMSNVIRFLLRVLLTPFVLFICIPFTMIGLIAIFISFIWTLLDYIHGSDFIYKLDEIPVNPFSPLYVIWGK